MNDKKTKLINLIKKQLGEEKDVAFYAADDINNLPSEVPFGIPTSLPEFDVSLGRKGLPAGRIIEFYGFEASAKSSLAMTIAAGCQKIGGDVLWIDTEQTFSRPWAEKFGIDVDDLLFGTADSIEGIFRLIDNTLDGLLKTQYERPFLVVVDSITAVPTEYEMKKVIEGEERLGGEARAIRRGLKHITSRCARQNVSIIFINHAIAKMTSYGKQSQAAGGHALKFYSSCRVEMANKAFIKTEEGERLGQNIKISIEKLKFAPLVRPTFEPELMYSTGWNKEESLLNAMITVGLVKHPKGAKVYTLYPDTSAERQITRAQWGDTLLELGGYDVVETDFYKQAEALGFILPWGV